MSQLVVTNEGWRFNHVTGSSSGAEWLLEMPCGEWEPISEEQFAGKVSVNHAAVCRATPNCGYHETHEYGPSLVASLRARHLTFGNLRAGENDIDEQAVPGER